MPCSPWLVPERQFHIRITVEVRKSGRQSRNPRNYWFWRGERGTEPAPARPAQTQGVQYGGLREIPQGYRCPRLRAARRQSKAGAVQSQIIRKESVTLSTKNGRPDFDSHRRHVGRDYHTHHASMNRPPMSRLPQ